MAGRPGHTGYCVPFVRPPVCHPPPAHCHLPPMDNKRLILTMVLAAGLILLWTPAVTWLGTQLGYDMTAARRTVEPTPAETAGDDAVTGDAAGETVAAGEVPATRPATRAVASGTTGGGSAVSAAPGGLRVTSAPAGDGGAVVLGPAGEKPDPRYPLRLELTPTGAAVASATLGRFREEVDNPAAYVFETPVTVGDETYRTLAVQTVTVDGRAVELADAAFRLVEGDQASATYAATVGDDAGDVLEVRRTYAIAPADPAAPDAGPAGYEVAVSTSFANLTDRELKVGSTIAGPAMPPRELERGIDRQVVGGYAAKNGVVGRVQGVDYFTADAPTADFTRDGDGELPLLWAGAESVYFAGIVRPVAPEGGSADGQIAKVEARLLNPSDLTSKHVVALTFDTAERTIAPGGTATLDLKTYFGPKWRRVLDNDYYGATGVRLDKLLVAPSYCPLSFEWLVGPMVWLLSVFHAVTRDWGLAIIGLVVLVRFCLHPITKRAQINMMKMGKLGPEVERLKKKHGEDKEALNKDVMALYKTQGAAPILGCLPMFLQTPIWIALWQALNSTFELRHAPFLYGFTWIDDLSKPDHLVNFADFGVAPFDLFFLHFSGLNLLPVLLGVVFYLQMKFQPQPATMTPEQEQQQKIMKVMMPLLFPLFLYASPSGLCLYILTSTTIGIFENKRIRAHVKEQERLEAEGLVAVDGDAKVAAIDAGSWGKGDGERPNGKAKGGRGKRPGRTPAEPEKPVGKVAAWWRDLQEKAEQIQRDAQKGGSRKPR